MLIKHTPHRRQTRALSERAHAAYESRSKNTPVLVSGISSGKLVNIQKVQFPLLDVDPAYQRGQTEMVNEIVRVLLNGGQVLDPVTLCRRRWGREDPDKLWIVDGYQRVCAFQQLGQSFSAVVHESETLNAEKQFFLALNNRRALKSVTIVKSWTGPSATLVERANTDHASSLFDRVNLTSKNNPYRIDATLLCKGALVACTGAMPRGTTTTTMSRLDQAISEPHRAELARRFLDLAGELFPQGRAYGLILNALALVAWERWSAGGDYPSPTVIRALRNINWDQEVPAVVSKFRDKIFAVYSKTWPKEGHSK